ncbi:MAG: pitrilysin family protein [bacterium]
MSVPGKKRISFLILGMIILVCVPASRATHLKNLVVEQTLSNGMKVLVLERHQSPTVSLYLRFRVGMIDEGGKGLAHLLEHMLFKGTTSIGTKNFPEEEKLLVRIDRVGEKIDSERKKGDRPEVLKELEDELKALQKQASQYVVSDEMSLLYTSNGAVGLNASTGADLTTYHVSLPSNRVELWARLESDRFENPVFREFYAERDVVLEERRQTHESEPMSMLWEQFLASAYVFHPYRNPVIGWESEVQFISKAEMEDFFKTYYVPNNAVITAVGDVQAKEFIALVQRYFGSLPRRESPPVMTAREPSQIGERRVTVRLDAQPQLVIGYHKPTLPSHEDYIFDLVDGILSGGRTSRLFQRLVEKDQIAVQVNTANGMPGARYANLFTVMATPRYPHTVQEVEQAIYEEIERLKKEQVTDREIQKIKNQLSGEFVRSLNSNSGLASKLSYFESVAGDWRYIDNHLEVIDKITPEQIQENVRKYLIEDNRTVAYLLTDGKKEQAWSSAVMGMKSAADNGSDTHADPNMEDPNMSAPGRQ